MEKIALYAGTFDPFTLGHNNILKRGLKVFDKIVVLVAPSAKKTLFSSDERVAMISHHFAQTPAIRVDSWKGLTVDYAKEKGIANLLRGVRPSGDFENEFQMSTMNSKLFPGIETVFLMASDEHHYISSSLIKEIYNCGGDVSHFVPSIIFKKMQELDKDEN